MWLFIIDFLVVDFVLFVLVCLYFEYLDICVLFDSVLVVVDLFKCEIDIVICILWLENFDLILRKFVSWFMGLFVFVDYLWCNGVLVFGECFCGYDLVMYEFYWYS